MSIAQQLMVPIYEEEDNIFLVRDDFTDTKAAGAVNGTSPTPGPGGARAVTDTDGDAVAVTGGNLAFTNPNANWTSHGITFPVIRTAGKAFIVEVKLPAGAYYSLIGLKTEAAIGAPTDVKFEAVAYLFAEAIRNYIVSATVFATTGTYTNQSYLFAQILRAAGVFHLISRDGGSTWTLLWPQNAGTTAALHAHLNNYDMPAPTSDTFRVAQLGRPWSDTYAVALGFATFTGANGTALADYTPERGPKFTAGVNWDIQTNKARNSPTAGGEVLTDGALENWASATDLTSWTETIAGTSTVNREGTLQHGGTYCARLDIDESNSVAQISQGAAIAGTWYMMKAWLRCASGTRYATMAVGATAYGVTLTTTYAEHVVTLRATTTAAPYIQRSAATSDSIYIDDVSIKPLTLSDLISGADYGYSDVLVNADLAVTAKTQAGVVACLDSLASPANFLLAYHDGTNATLLKCVAGTYTSLISAAATYVANAPIRIIKDGTTVTLFYNNALVGTAQTVSDAGIISNKIHGTFSTFASNTVDNFEVWPRKVIGYARQELERWTR